ncbi:site-2 protease family protein [Saccharopolyspora rosea]|uniref:site-2 protease family protein n=1 Tax=Saccharopolyspora rosea TaxID=524884 RepID=UPI0021D922F7|nr:site-2 protease family protein [Saccharopolyspora rosea]
MNDTVVLGRIAGVRVGLHWSAVGIVALVAVGLAVFQLPRAFPGHSPVGYATGGVVGAVLLLLSLLGHEVAHAVVARRNGVVVSGITLWLLGGVARLRGEARGPGADFRIAAVGPAASVVLGGVFAGIAWLLVRWEANELVVAVPLYLGLLNIVLAVFNLIPAAPLDGGRVLRSVLWAWRGDRYRAAVWSARAGEVFGVLLAAAGVAELWFRGAEGFWSILLGWFVVSVAAAEERQARLGQALADVRVRDVMSAPRDGAAFAEVAAEPDEPLAAVLSRLGETGGTLPVIADGRLVGIVSAADVGREAERRGVRMVLPGAEPHRPPPPGWWYPGQHR